MYYNPVGKIFEVTEGVDCFLKGDVLECHDVSLEECIYMFKLKRKNYGYVAEVPIDKFHNHYLEYDLMVLKGSIGNKVDLNKHFGFKRFVEKEKSIQQRLKNGEENMK